MYMAGVEPAPQGPTFFAATNYAMLRSLEQYVRQGVKKICGFFNRPRELNYCRMVSALWSALSLLCSFVQKLSG